MPSDGGTAVQPPFRPIVRKQQHLLDGRRVTVQDLVRADLLEAGQRLLFARSRVGVVHEATVTDRGRIRTADGHEHGSPSGAAVAVTGIAVDGWHAWQVGENGPFLSQLRRRLLESSLAEET